MKKELILVVDDNHELGKFITEKLLPSIGYECKLAQNGRSAIASIHTSMPSLLLLDLELPDMSGLDLLRKLKQEQISIPTILFTAHGSEMIAIEAFHLGVEDYLIKPVDPELLSESIGQALEGTRLRNEKARLVAELNEQITWLLALSKIGQSLTSTLDLDEVLRRIVEAGVQLTQADEGFIALLDHSTGTLFLRASKNLDGETTSTLRLPIADSLLGEAISTGKPTRKAIQSFERRLKIGTGLLVNSLLNVPIFSRGRPLGVLSVDNRKKNQSFTHKDEVLLSSLADYAAVALENANLYLQARREITERKRIENALRESEERYALAARGANDGIWDLDLKKYSIHLSLRWKEMLGYQDSDIGNNPNEWFSRIHPDDLQALKMALSALTSGRMPHMEVEYRIRHRDHTYRWMLCRGVAVQELDGVVSRVAGSQTDISERKTVEARLLHDALHDKLTELPNRALFLDHLEKAIERVRQEREYSYAVLFLDLDQFKDINDSLGHPTGDRLLIAVAHLLKNTLRLSDTVARLGGDEFVILLDGIRNSQEAIDRSKRILQVLEEPVKLGRHNISISTSIGIVLGTLGYERPEDVLRDADIAMYAAKNQGKSTYQLFDPQMRQEIMERIALEADIQQAVVKNQLQLYYQPIIALKDGHLIGFEALIHWRHPHYGLMPAGKFLPIAQETGQILQIDWWVFEEACEQIQGWQKKYNFQPPLKASINLGSSLLLHANLVPSMLKRLETSGFPPQNLVLEIPESVVATYVEALSHIISDIKKQGISVQIDDFGTGISSLPYIKELPIDALKIDQAFVNLIKEDGANTEIPRNFIRLAHELGIKTIAEGIESTAQFTQLRRIGCDVGQGFLFCSPLEKNSAERLLDYAHKGNHHALPWHKFWNI